MINDHAMCIWKYCVPHSSGMFVLCFVITDAFIADDINIWSIRYKIFKSCIRRMLFKIIYLRNYLSDYDDYFVLEIVS